MFSFLKALNTYALCSVNLFEIKYNLQQTVIFFKLICSRL